MSFNVVGESDAFFAELKSSMETLTDCGVRFVVAAGNWSFHYRYMLSPATYLFVLSVGSIDHRDDSLMYGSGTDALPEGLGDRMKSDLVALGVDICAALARPSRWENEFEEDVCGPTIFENGEQVHTNIIGSGTSYAAPHVMGVAALVKQAHP